MTLANIFFLLLLVALNGFFTAFEFAVVTSRRARLDLIANPNSRGARLLHKWLDQPTARERLVAGSQLGITIASLALGSVGENLFEELLTPYFQVAAFPAWLSFLRAILPALPLVISLVVVTSFHVVLGEQVPKVAVLRSPERFALWAAPIMDVFNRFFYTFISLLDGATHAILRMLGLGDGSTHNALVSLEEFKEMVEGPEMEGVMEVPQREMISAVVDFSEMLVRQVTVPRTEIVAVEADTPLNEVIDIAVANTVTRLPVYEDDLDQVLGIIHLRDLLRCQHDSFVEGQTARSLAREVLFVPETTPVRRLLAEFRAHRAQMAIVLDEFGGTAGLVTIEDLLEEIIGEEHDDRTTDNHGFSPRPDGSYLLDGMTQISEVNDYFNLNLVDPDYDTIAGYVLGKLHRIAKTGDRVDDDENGITLTVAEMDALRISQVLVQKTPPAETPQK